MNPVFAASSALLRDLQAAGCIVGGTSKGVLVTFPDGQWRDSPLNTMAAVDKMRADALMLLPAQGGMQ